MKRNWILGTIAAVALAVTGWLAWFAGGGEPVPAPIEPVSSTSSDAVATTSAVVAPRPAAPAPSPAAASSSPAVGRVQFRAGPITEVFDGGFKVRVNQGKIRTIVIGPNTVLRRYAEDGVAFEPLPLSALAPDLRVRVVGTSLEDGGTLAKTVTTGTAASSGSSGSVSIR